MILYLFISLILTFQLFEIFGRNQTVFILEALAEVSDAVHAHHERNLADGVFAFQQEVLSILHLVFSDVLVG